MPFNLARGTSGRPSQLPTAAARRFALACEPLETRQLLSISVFLAAIASGSSPVAKVQPNVSLIPVSSSASPGAVTQQINTAYGVNQIAFEGMSWATADQTMRSLTRFDEHQSDLSTFDAEFGWPHRVHAIRQSGSVRQRAGRWDRGSMSNGRAIRTANIDHRAAPVSSTC
jgi:hypothetical protein